MNSESGSYRERTESEYADKVIRDWPEESVDAVSRVVARYMAGRYGMEERYISIEAVRDLVRERMASAAGSA